uniref:Uncharacterized protein n=1 Tax=Magallana gigas TaxID=29159 RepID=A0A8W8P6S9_MAGGI
MDIGIRSVPDRHLRSVRTLTQQALMLFKDKVEKYNDRLRDVRRDIETVILEFEDVRPTEENVQSAMKSDLIHFANQYNSLSKEYVSYLKGTRTAASLREEASHRLVASSVRGKVDYMITEIESRLRDNVPSYTRFAESNGQTEGLPLRAKEEVVRNLSYSFLKKESSIGKAKVGLQTAKLDLKFAEEEAELLRKQAAIEAERKILESQNREDQVSVSSIRSFENFCNPKHSTPCEKNQDLTSNLNQSAKPFSPYGFDHLTRYIAKKDLISSRFSTYDDNPTHYSSWRATFQNIVTEVQASPLEHLDLLVRWLGPDSTRQVKSIRSANVQDQEKALKLALERLDTRFGSPEIIQHTLQQWILDFPKLQNHQRKEFFDLADLATEIERIKSDDQNAITLAYFDSSYGVNKLVSILPFNLQEKWTHKAIEADDDVEIRKEVVNLKTETSDPPEKVLSLTARFTKFSSWKSQESYHKLKGDCCAFPKRKTKSVEQFIIKEVQHKVYQEEVQSIMKGSKPPKNSSLLPLYLVLDPNGILRILQHISTNRPYEDDHHPIIIPKGHHIALLLIYMVTPLVQKTESVSEMEVLAHEAVGPHQYVYGDERK